MSERNEADRSMLRMRAVAHPLRLQILSLLTSEALSAADVARRLEITHANASYHLRRLLEAGEVEVESESKVRGGVAKRYRYTDFDVRSPSPSAGAPDLAAWAQAAHSEVLRRSAHYRRPGGRAHASDLEAWVSTEAWEEYVDLLNRAMARLHEQARPAGTEGTVHISATVTAFEMGDDA
ncbi:ArsR/SmtB family transcription factor [Nocardioides rotundus]|uniref:ArsR/SmtB family transcription factor n=1 Tax=Nocardioides rotundus TaxID=1774216 RepID=UPI001CBF1A6B|nr:winged helix-turn-helix domain-containing protein [Nocardioides rotundus]